MERFALVGNSMFNEVAAKNLLSYRVLVFYFKQKNPYQREGAYGLISHSTWLIGYSLRSLD